MLLLLTVSSLRVPAAGTNKMEIDAFINTNGEPYLVMRITNRGSEPQTVLTENYSESGIEFNGRMSPMFDVSFSMGATGSKTNLWNPVPSLPKLAPVTLFKDETATLVKKLDARFMDAIRNPDTMVRLRYSIRPSIAKRFGLWEGTIEAKETARAMMSK